MLRLASYDIVFQEIPGEVTLALNLSGCPNRCPGCHSPHLREAVGEVLDNELMDGLIRQYGDSVTCICFMGGDGDTGRLEQLALRIREWSGGRLKTGWYSGRTALPATCEVRNFDYIKLGPYIEERGGLDSETTNQRCYQIVDGERVDITDWFRKKAGMRCKGSVS